MCTYEIVDRDLTQGDEVLVAPEYANTICKRKRTEDAINVPMKMRIIVKEKDFKEEIFKPERYLKHGLLRHWLNKEEPVVRIGFESFNEGACSNHSLGGGDVV